MVIVLGILFLVVGLSGCEELLDRYTIHAPYSYIKSYRNGGGIFLVNMTPRFAFKGNVSLTCNASEHLHVELTNERLSEDSPVSEILIRPDNLTRIGLHDIELTASDGRNLKKLTLQVNISNCSIGAPSDYVIGKRNVFMQWLEREYPDFDNISNQDWFAYMTYAEILVVEHWTFLSSEWEMRVCCHITIPPHNWSMLRLRKRGDIEPMFAAKCDYNGTLYEIPVSDYPTLFGY